MQDTLNSAVWEFVGDKKVTVCLLFSISASFQKKNTQQQKTSDKISVKIKSL